MASSIGPHSQPSLPALPAHLQSDTQLTAHLASRFHAGLPTACLSSHALISLNTYTSSAKAGQNADKEGSAMAGAEEMAERAWLRLGHRSENQAVVFLGESGSGKSTIRSHLLTAILNKTSDNLSAKISLASYVFDSLTTTKTATTPTASKAGLFYELQYDTALSTRPQLIGAKLLDHRLERSRIADVPTGERNFHIFYYLLAGLSERERHHLCMDGQQRWRFLGHPTQLKVGINDGEGFAVFKNALRRLEFARTEIAELAQMLAVILHIGQLEFDTTADTAAQGDDSGGFSHEGATLVTAVKNKETLRLVAAFLQVSAQELQTTLGYKTKMIHKERVTVMLDPAGARAHANELARTLYSLLVAWVMEKINQNVCAPEESIANTVSIIDFPGFAQQSSTRSTLDQLLTNAACESLYGLALQAFFDRRADMLESEDVVVPATSYFDNSDAVRGLLKPGNGLLSILDDQTRRNRTDQQLLEALRKRFEGKNAAISVGSATAKLPGSNFYTENAAACFTIKHFAAEVDYPIRGLIEENGEVISGDLLSLVNSTRSEFVRRLFGQDALQTVTHPIERSTVMQATVSSKPARAPSVVSRKGTTRAVQGILRRQQLREQQQQQPEHEEAAATSSGGVGAATGTRSLLGGHTEQGASGQYLSSLENVTRAITDPNCNTYFVLCLKPNDRRISNQFDSKCVRAQVQTLGVAEISQRLRSADFSLFLPFGEFLGLAEGGVLPGAGTERDRASATVAERRWPENEARVGATGVFLSERCWLESAQLESALGRHLHPGMTPSDAGDGLSPTPHMERDFGASKERLLLSAASGNTPMYGGEKGRGGYFGAGAAGGGGVGGGGGGGNISDDARSEAGVSAVGGGDLFKNLDTVDQMAERGEEKKLEEVEEYKDSPSRRRWVVVVYALTWLIPDLLIRKVGRMSRRDVRVAWREKLAINILIWFFCLVATFFIIGFPMLICPKQNVFSASELAAFNGQDGAASYASVRGFVFDIGEYAPRHYPAFIGTKAINQYAGLDISSLFPVQVSALCGGKDGAVDPDVTLDYKSTNISGSPTLVSLTDRNSIYHDFRAFRNDSRPDWYYEQMTILRSSYLKGRVGYSPEYVGTLANKQQYIAILNGRVYDMTAYMAGGRRMPVHDDGTPPPSDPTLPYFMDDGLVSLFKLQSGSDLTKLFYNLDMTPAERARMLTCLNNLFYVGDVDTRNSVRCQFAQYLILAVSAVLTAIIAFKFFAALQFGTRNMPENLDKFIMCQIPAYTEDEDSLRRAIDSAARMRYDDKRKLLVVVCDGMIIGQGNDRPTPRIVLDILGVPESVNPDPLSFESLGEGQKQHNMGKVYSGLYEVQGHIVPFLVIVKVGKPSEVGRPGNRGKRDSQMIVMRFLNRVHYNLPMSPLELEIYHQIRNIIGVNPTFYEFMLQIDADTVVASDSATRMVSAFIDDTRLIAVCGETALTNAKASFITMIQVYEYYISHNLAKAFESLFGSVTCLPGCFSMYRIRAHDTGKPLFVSREIVEAYSTIRVDTLHMKNLLHLGEDRYLTTLLLKFHNKYKTKYIFRAHAWTIAPDSWQVFLSQRRRWINSTVHNLIELIPMAQLCGFCCFSMRFIVFVDLLSTLVQPVVIAYITYLIVLVATSSTVVPLTAFIMLGAIYGLQAIIFILRRKWEMIGWMILYVLAIPVFSFGLPLYSFWHMDDFNWGNTRVVAGEKGKKIVVSDEGKFDPASIPRKKWEEYQAEMWESQTARDDAQSVISGYSYATKAGGYGSSGAAMSEYGGGGGAGVGWAPAAPPYLGVGSRPVSRTSVGGFLMPGGGVGGGDPRYSSRLSLAPDVGMMGAGGNRVSYAGSSHLGGAGMIPGEDPALLPSDDAILAETKMILSTMDLMQITKKGVKKELENRFGCSLETRKAFINSVIMTEVERLTAERSAMGQL